MPFNEENRSGAPGRGLGQGRSRGRQPGGFGLGPGDFCVCPSCKTKIPHKRGIPCYEETCPECGSRMTRERDRHKKIR